MKFKWNDNLSFKFVALGVALILWASILGRKDSTMTKDFELQVLLGPNLEMTTGVPTIVKTKSRARAWRSKRSTDEPGLHGRFTAARAGRQVVRLSRDGLSLPIGSKVVGIDPAEFTVQLRVATPAEKD